VTGRIGSLADAVTRVALMFLLAAVLFRRRLFIKL
jgi:hypothetical protein